MKSQPVAVAPINPMLLQLIPTYISRLVKILSTFLVFAAGIAVGTISTSYLRTIPLPIPLQTIQLSSLFSPPPPFSIPPLPLQSPPPPAAKILDDVAPSNNVVDVMKNDITDDDELLRKASSMIEPLDRAVAPPKPKVAFMFLVRGIIPFAPLWEKFFRGHHGLYSVYVHADPSYTDDHLSQDSVFYGRRIPSKVVRWGEMSMMEAERRLLANALLDLSNQRFVLLSEACIPLYNFPDIYSYLVNSTQSFVQVYDDPGANGRGRYNRHMAPQIKLRQWRKGSQWFEMDRTLAVETVSDDVYFPVFKRHCRPSCYADEHYLPTFININAMRLGGRNAGRSLTWVDWSRGGPHPARINRPDVNPEMLRWLRNGGGKECSYNGEMTKMCYLFARKFLPNSLVRLERYAPSVMGFG